VVTPVDFLQFPASAQLTFLGFCADCLDLDEF
jgi:hypothetical protein